MPTITLRKLLRFVSSLVISVAMLAVLADLFLIPIQTFIVENMRGVNVRLPETNTVEDRSTAEIRRYVREALEKDGWPEERKVVINLGETTARLDFSFAVSKDHELADVVQNGIARYIPRAFVEMVFGNWVVMDTPLEDDDFQVPSIDLDTSAGSITLHFVALRPIEKEALLYYSVNPSWSEAELFQTVSLKRRGPGLDTVVINHPDRKLLRVHPFPVESASEAIGFAGEDIGRDYIIIETEVMEEGPVSLAQIFSRQKLLQRVGNLLDIPFVASLLSAILEALPLLIFLSIVLRWKGRRPTSLMVLSEVVIALLSFHFAYYLSGAVSNLYSVVFQRLSLAGFQRDISILFSSFYQIFGLDYIYVSYIPLGFLSVGTVLMGVLIPVMLMRRSRQWDELGGGAVHLTDPLNPQDRPPSVPRRVSIGALLTYTMIALLILVPVGYYIYAQQNGGFLNTSDFETHLLLVSFQVGFFGLLLMLAFRGLYIMLDGQPIPHQTVPIAFWVVFMGNLIWSLAYGLQNSVQRDISVQAGWLWLVYATALGAFLVYAVVMLVYALAKRAGLVSAMDRRSHTWLVFFCILSAIPMRLLYSSSAAPADYYEVMGLAGRLDNLLQFIFLAGLTWFFYEHGRKSPALSPLTIAVGLLAAAAVLYPSNAHWLFIPLTFLLGYRFLFSFIKPARYWKQLEPLYTRVFHERLHFLEELVNLNNGERGYRDLHKALSIKMGKDELSYNDFKRKLDERRAELDENNEKAKVHGQPIKDVALTFGPRPTAWENGVHGAFWAALFSVPWISIWLNNFMAGEVTTSGYPLWAFLADLLNLLISWVGIGFLFGYFYPFLRGKNGLQKGIWLWLVIVLPALPLALVNNSAVTDWQGFFFWILQVFIHCMLLGLIAFDYMTLRQGYRDWQMLFELHGIPSVGVSISTILIAAGTAVTTLFQEQTQEIIRTALTFILPNVDKLIDAEQVISTVP